MTCLSCNDKYHLKVKQDKRGEASNKGCHTDSYFSTPKIKDINWLMKIHYFSVLPICKNTCAHTALHLLMSKGISGAQRRKEPARKRKSLDQNRCNRITYFKTIDTVTTIAEKMFLYFLFSSNVWNMDLITHQRKSILWKWPFCSNLQQRLQRRPYPPTPADACVHSPVCWWIPILIAC